MSPWTTITQERIDRFADATGDHQWIHVDPDRARAESPFGATIAQRLPRALALSEPARPRRPEHGAVARRDPHDQLRRQPRPVPRARFGPAARLRGRFELVGATERNGAVQVVERVTVELDSGDKPACVAEVVRLLYFD